MAECVPALCGSAIFNPNLIFALAPALASAIDGHFFQVQKGIGVT